MTEQNSLPMVALRGLTILPEMVAHFDVSRERSMQAVRKRMQDDQKIFLADTERSGSGRAGAADLYRWELLRQ